MTSEHAFIAHPIFKADSGSSFVLFDCLAVHWSFPSVSQIRSIASHGRRWWGKFTNGDGLHSLGGRILNSVLLLLLDLLRTEICFNPGLTSGSLSDLKFFRTETIWNCSTIVDLGHGLGGVAVGGGGPTVRGRHRTIATMS